MQKLATDPDAADVVDIRLPVGENVRRFARAKKESPSDVTVVLLDRPRHQDMAEEVRATGDLLVSIGGTPEGIIAACAIKTLGGVIQGRLWPKDDDERQKAVDAGHDLDRVWSPTRVGSGRGRLLRATGITDGELLKGVRY